MAKAHVFSNGIQSPLSQLNTEYQMITENDTLSKRCTDRKLNDFMLLQSFTSRAWIPPNFVNPSGEHASAYPISGPRGEGYLPTAFHPEAPIWPKTFADLTESVIGAGLLTDGIDGALHVARCLNITPHPIHSLGEAAEMYRQQTSKEICRQDLDNKIGPKELSKLQGFLGYTFRSTHIALRVTQPSANFEGMVLSVKLLELLGDAVVGYLVVTAIFERNPGMDPGELTTYKDKLFMSSTLGALAEAVGMHRVLSSAPDAPQLAFNETLQLRRIEECQKPEGQRGNYWAKLKTPKSAAGLVKTLVGAVALDSSFDLKVLKELYDRLFKPFYDEFCRQGKEVDDTVREFEQFMDKLGCKEWHYVRTIGRQNKKKVYCTAIHVHNVIWMVRRHCKTQRLADYFACRDILGIFRNSTTRKYAGVSSANAAVLARGVKLGVQRRGRSGNQVRPTRNWLTDLPDDRIHDFRFLAEKDVPDVDLVLEVKETGAKPPVQQAVQLLDTLHANLVSVDSVGGAAHYTYEQLPKKEGFRCSAPRNLHSYQQNNNNNSDAPPVRTSPYRVQVRGSNTYLEHMANDHRYHLHHRPSGPRWAQSYLPFSQSAG
ncbi:hypothetical protein CF319_g8982, partial [Tilletia indica]